MLADHYVSTVLLNPGDPLVNRDADDRQELHRTVMSLFPDEGGLARRERQVLYVLHDLVGGPVLRVQARGLPSWTALPRNYVMAHLGAEAVEYTLGLARPGASFRFGLTANVTKKTVDPRGGNGRRVPLNGDARLEWLERKGSQHGFRVLEAEVEREHEVMGRRRGKRLTFRATQFAGRLEVSDSGLFRRAVLGGIGPGKAYGFGLLVLREVPRDR